MNLSVCLVLRWQKVDFGSLTVKRLCLDTSCKCEFKNQFKHKMFQNSSSKLESIPTWDQPSISKSILHL